jgi:peptide deformylase
MAVRKLIVYPDPILHQVSQPVTEFGTSELTQLVADMQQTMVAANGIGLSAIQIGVPLRVIIVHQTQPDNIETLINPVIQGFDGSQVVEEGCLSVPGVFEDRRRAFIVYAQYFDLDGNKVEKTFRGVEAFCLQHELDHLDGKVFIDEMSSLKKNRARGKITKTVKRLRRDPTTLGAY